MPRRAPGTLQCQLRGIALIRRSRKERPPPPLSDDALRISSIPHPFLSLTSLAGSFTPSFFASCLPVPSALVKAPVHNGGGAKIRWIDDSRSFQRRWSEQNMFVNTPLDVILLISYSTLLAFSGCS